VDAMLKFWFLKDETLFLIKNVSDSLLNIKRIQVLIPLIAHNLSRYNTNIAVMNEYFAGLMTQVSGQGMRSELSDAFAKLAESLLGGAGAREAEAVYQALKQAEANPFGSQMLGKSIAAYLAELLDGENHPRLNYDEEYLNSLAKGFLLGKESGLETIKNMLQSLLNNSATHSSLDAEMARIDDISKLVEYLNGILRNMPDVPERQAFFELLNEVIKSMNEKNELIPKDDSQAAGKQAATESKESTLKQLINFIEKHIEHAAIKTINNYNASNLLQSLINAPGVFTPLAHYIIPLEVDGTRSFGELWVDADDENEAAKAKGENCKYHLFLTFEVEAAGRFEIDLYADGRDVNLSFFYPESFSEKAGPLLGRVGKIISGTGYNTREIRTGPLMKPHDLTQIFPDILERRTGFNVKA